MNKTLPGVKYTGYDNNPEMLILARNRLTGFSNINFTNTFPNNICDHNSLLNLSSVIHEVYSYCDKNEIEKFWNNVFLSGFDYISIRDMCVLESVDRKTSRTDYWKLLKCANKNQVKDFESTWGSLMDNRNFVHFLMKYRYVKNWNREVNENYFPITLKELVNRIPMDKYDVKYLRSYCLPYTKSVVKKDFGIDIKDNTHVQLLLKKRM